VRALIEGSPWWIEHGTAGDLRMEHALAHFHLDAGATELQCAPADHLSPAWRRLLLDTALVTAALKRGHDALHAGCVVIDGRAIAVAAPQGSGKTSLTVELVRQGGRFLADDVVALEPDGGRVLALPAPPVANVPTSAAGEHGFEQLHEFGDELWVRVRDAATEPAPLGLVIVLSRTRSPDPPRLVPVRDPAAPLLAHALHTGSAPDRLARRFELMGRLAASAEVAELTVTDASPPAMLAELVASGLR
jgi:hypothetical protein